MDSEFRQIESIAKKSEQNKRSKLHRALFNSYVFLHILEYLDRREQISLQCLNKRFYNDILPLCIKFVDLDTVYKTCVRLNRTDFCILKTTSREEKWLPISFKGSTKLGIMDKFSSHCVSKNGKEIWISSGLPTSIKIFGKFFKVNIENYPYIVEKKEPMQSARYGHALIFFKSMIFAIGGQNSLETLNSVEVYHISKDYWEDLEPINKPRAYVHGCTVGNKIYIFSSVEEDHSFYSDATFEVLDAKMIYNKWTTITLKCGRLSTVTNVCCFQSKNENQILILQPNDRKLYEFDFTSDFLAYKLNIRSKTLHSFLEVADKLEK